MILSEGYTLMADKSRSETKTLKVGDIAIEVLTAPGDMPNNEDLFEALRKI